MLKNRAPKYGNDLDEPDEMSNFAVEVLCDALEGYKTARGGLFTAGIYYMTANVPNGKRTAATPNGRHAYEPLNDGGVSPSKLFISKFWILFIGNNWSFFYASGILICS